VPVLVVACFTRTLWGFKSKTEPTRPSAHVHI
jgi:hypothetical protein